MLLIWLSHLVLSIEDTTADLKPPYEITSMNTVGFWEFGGSSLVHEDIIMLVPPIQYHKGFLWTNVEIPQGKWGIRYNMRVSEGVGGGFAIWFVDRYGADGELHGGPNSFLGIGIFATIKSYGAGRHNIYFNFIQSTDAQEYKYDNLPKPDAIEMFSDEPFELEIKYDKNMITITYNKKQIISKKLDIDLSQLYTGITAATYRETSRIDVKSIEFILEEFSPIIDVNKVRNDVSMGQHHSAYFKPEHQSLLRGDQFNITLEELSKYVATGGIDSASYTTPKAEMFRVLDVIEELNAQAYQVASFSELNMFVKNNLLPYSEKWQKRTLKVIERVQEARNVAGAAYNFTTEIIKTFNSTLRQSVLKANMKIISLTEVLNENAELGIAEDEKFHEISKEVHNTKLYRILTYIALAEIVILALYVASLKIPFVHTYMLGY